MKGKKSFSREEADEIIRLLGRKLAAGRTDQKTIRAKIRKLRFYISDFRDGGTFSDDDFRELIQSGAVTVRGEVSSSEKPSSKEKLQRTRKSLRHRASAMRQPRKGDVNASDIIQAIAASRTPSSLLEDVLPAAPGLYGVFIKGREALAGTVVRNHSASQPIYIGKAEKSLESRHRKEHFSVGKSGSSTLRRALGAILRTKLGLRPIRSGHTGTKRDFTHYKFDNASEERLTSWMRNHLVVGWWPLNGHWPLRALETQVIKELNPPLNDHHSAHRLVSQVRDLRKECRRLATPPHERRVDDR